MKTAKATIDAYMKGNRFAFVQGWHRIPGFGSVERSVWLDKRNEKLYHAYVMPNGQYVIYTVVETTEK